MKNLKSMYEKEISKLRQHLEEFSHQKNMLQLQNSKLEATASDLQIRLVCLFICVIQTSNALKIVGVICSIAR